MCSASEILKQYLPETQLEFVNNSIFGYTSRKLNLPAEAVELANSYGIELQGYEFETEKRAEENWSQVEIETDANNVNVNQIVRVGLFQNSIIESTSEPIWKQKQSLLELAGKAIAIAAKCSVNIFCFQELWTMPWAFCTQKKLPWTEFAENTLTGPTTQFLKLLAKEHNLVIISSILERDENEYLWNTVVVIDADGQILGKTRKNHIPISGKFSETSYYRPSTLGIPVFQTQFAKIGLTICYDRHQLQHWYTHRLNQAQIIFNPTATVQTFSEPFWGVEARAAAKANGYFVCAINRVGTEHFKMDDSKVETAGPFFGSSYITAPNGVRTPGLGTNTNGLLIGDLQLSECVKFQENADDLEQISRAFLQND